MLSVSTYLRAIVIGSSLLIPSAAARAQDDAAPSQAPQPNPALAAPEPTTDGDAAYVPPPLQVPTTAPMILSDNPVSVALRGLGVRDDAVERFYSARDHALFWLGSDRAWADALLASLDAAPTHGLPQARYDAAGLRAALAGPRDPAGEAAFMRTYLRFARDLSSGMLEPNEADREIHIRPSRPEAAALLARLAAPSAPANFDDLAPAAPEYAVLRKALTDFRSQATVQSTVPPVPAGRTLRPGDRSERVAALRARMIALGDYGVAPEPAETGTDAEAEVTPVAAVVTEPADPNLYDEALVAAVKRFQARSGLNDDGVAGPQTVAAINATQADRQAQLIVNLERVRWLHRDMNERHIFVNQADYMMELVENGKVLLESRVVVGKTPKNRTPEFIDMMDHMVVNPSWHVPVSIATQEILPILKNDPGYLSRKGMKITPIGGASVPDGVNSSYSQFSAGYFPFRIRQNPSESNALGRVKFMFPNQFSIYLHDTPQKSLFNRDARAFSHGCVRVQKPFDLAHALLEGQEEDPKAAFERLLNRKAERRIDLDRPVRVYLTYRTAFVDHDGVLQYRADVYGRDTRVLAALKEAGVALID